jgi:hypothetical protein
MTNTALHSSTTAFISGHRNTTDEEFAAFYVPLLQEGIASGTITHFVIGDYEGVDAMAQRYLAEHLPHVPVTVFHMFTAPRNLASHSFRSLGGFTTDEERDAAMTQASSHDIAWVRKGKERSGTAQNLARRLDPTVNIYQEDSA